MQGGPGVDRSVGMFINTLPIRVEIGEEGVAASVGRVHALLGQLLHHEHASLALAQRCSAVPAPAPLFTPLLNYRYSGAGTSPDSEGVELLGVKERTNYPVALSVDDLGEGFILMAGTKPIIGAERLCDFVRMALEGLADALERAPDTPVRLINVLGEAERHRVVVEWNATAADHPRDRCVHELFEAQVARTPDATAVVFEDTGLSYAELNARANRLAYHLISLGVKPDNRIAICVERGIETVVALLAVLKSGGAYVPLDPSYPAERLAYMFMDSAPMAVLTQAKLWSFLEPFVRDAHIVALDDDAAKWTEESADNPCPAAVGLRPGHLAYVIYTSGSTGTPKGVMIEHAALRSRVLIEGFAVRPDSRALQFASFGFDACTFEVLMALCRGATLYVPASNLMVGLKLQQVLEANRISHASLPPSVLRTLPNDANLPALSTLVMAGEAADPTLVRRWAGGRRLINAYGPTETTVAATMQLCDAAQTETVPIGRPIPNTQVYILDAFGSPFLSE
jgi:amino acid adenylation domain-containing protein